MKKITVYFGVIAALLGALFNLGCGKSHKKGTENPSVMTKADSLSPAKWLASLTHQIKMNPHNYALYSDRSEVYLRLDSLDAAIRDIDKAITINDSISDLHYLRGFYACIDKDTTKAIAELEKAMRLGTINAEVPYQLGQIALMQKDYPRAEDLFNQAIRRDSSQAQYYFAKGLLYQSQKNGASALGFYKESIERDSTFSKAYLQLYDLYMNQLKNEDMANQQITKLLALIPSHPLGNYYKAKKLFGDATRLKVLIKKEPFMEAMAQAVAAYNLAIKADSGFVQAYYERGYTYFIMDKLDEAIRDFEKTATLDPNYYQAYFMLGSIHEFYKDNTTALSYYEKAVNAKPDFKEAIYAVKELRNKK